MLDNNLSQTGQVAPETDNPQNTSTELYQQKAQSDIQNTNDNLLNGQASSSLVLPDGQSSVTPESSIVYSSDSLSTDQNVPLYVVFIPIVILVITLLFVLLFAKKNPDKEVEEQEYDIDQDEVNDSIPISVKFDDDELVELSEPSVEVAVPQKPIKKKKSKSKKRKKK